MPAFEKKDWILAAIRNNRVMVISGETGCGKSTLVPQLVCDADNLVPPDKVRRGVDFRTAFPCCRALGGAAQCALQCFGLHTSPKSALKSMEAINRYKQS